MVKQFSVLSALLRAGLAALALSVLSMGIASAQAHTQAEVNAALRADTEIFNGLFVMGIAHGIRDTCPTIDARMLRANSLALSLYNRARSMGFSRDQIRSFLRDDDHKAELRAIVIEYYNQRGAQVEQPETICALGEAEIAAGTSAGALLRAR
ncbi:MAG: DUF5333 domain-containing protein [Pararhodobacter sp.]|nr:DUF5333 domain-containing protein [Pararhodobacter sp.]